MSLKASRDRGTDRLKQQNSLAARAVTQGEAEFRRGNFITNALPNVPQAEPQFINEHPRDFLRRTNLLPSAPRAAALLQWLRDEADRESKLNRAEVDELLELQQERRERDLRVRELTLPEFAARSGLDAVPEGHESVRQARSLLAETDRKLAENERRSSERKKSGKRALTSRLEKFLSENCREWHDIDPVKPTLDHPTLVSRISSLQEELKQVRKAPPSTAEVCASVEAQVNALASKGKPIVTGTKVQWPRNDFDQPADGFALTRDATFPLQAFTTVRSPDAHAMLCWLFKDQILKELTANLPKGGMTSGEKRTRIAELETQLLNLEREECALVNQSNGALQFRKDANPIAVLGIA